MRRLRLADALTGVALVVGVLGAIYGEAGLLGHGAGWIFGFHILRPGIPPLSAALFCIAFALIWAGLLLWLAQ